MRSAGMQVVVATLLCVVLASSAWAGEIDTAKGSKQLIFQFSGLTDLGVSGYTFRGAQGILSDVLDGEGMILSDLDAMVGGIGMRYYISDGTAIRPGLAFTYGKLTENATEEGDRDTEGKLTGFGASVALEKHMGDMKSLSPFVGLLVGFHSDKLTEEGGTVDFTYEDEFKLTSFEISALAGFEWGFADHLTLGGEYMLGYSHGSVKVEQTFNGQTETTADLSANRFGFGTASLFLSVAM